MTDTVIDSITDALVVRLRTVPQIADPRAVELEPTGDPDLFPSLALMIGDGDPIEREAGLIRWEILATVEGYAQRGDGADASKERSALHAAAVAAIMADDQLGHLVENVEPQGFRFVTATLADKRRLSFAQDFAIQFVTSRINPALPA